MLLYVVLVETIPYCIYVFESLVGTYQKGYKTSTAVAARSGSQTGWPQWEPQGETLPKSLEPQLLQ